MKLHNNTLKIQNIFVVIDCYAITNEDTIETKNKCFSGDLLKNWRNKAHVQF